MSIKKTPAQLGRLIKDLGLLTNIPDKFTAKRIQNIINKILKNDIDFQSTMTYISINLKMAKTSESKEVWFKVTNLIRDFFKEENE
jgi:Ca2+-binding EF-hand superfamily protein